MTGIEFVLGTIEAPELSDAVQTSALFSVTHGDVKVTTVGFHEVGSSELWFRMITVSAGSVNVIWLQYAIVDVGGP